MSSLCEQCCEFYNHMRDFLSTESFGSISSYEWFLSEYKKLMHKVLRREFHIYGKNKRNRILYQLGEGNWKHLWQTPEEEQKENTEIVAEMIGEIWYCSDRWTWDRVLRVNWWAKVLSSRLAIQKWEKENEKEDNNAEE